MQNYLNTIQSFSKKFIIYIVGPTCIGKTSLSIFLAKNFKTEILSSDSRQFYKELKIGSNQPTYKDISEIHHHFIGHKSIHDNYNVKEFEEECLNKISFLFNKYSVLIMVGGSGLYEKSITIGLSKIPKINPKIRNNLIYCFKKKGIKYLQEEFIKLKKKDKTIDIKNPRRLIRYLEIVKSTGHTPCYFFKKKPEKRKFSVIKIGLILPKNKINYNINNRVDMMIKNGLIEEAEKLYPYKHLNSLKTIGYRELFDFFSKKNNILKLDNYIEKIKINTIKYAKRQITWYKKDNTIKWFNPKDKEYIFNFIIKKMGNTGFEPVTFCL